MNSIRNTFQRLNPAGATASPSGPIASGWGRYLWYGSIVVLCLGVLVAFYFLYPYFNKKAQLDSTVGLPDRQTAFTKFPVHPDLSANFVEVLTDQYTISADLYLPGVFDMNGIPRVLLYRSHKPVHLGVADLSGMNLEPFPLLTLFPDTNFLVWMDAITNDLYVSIITKELPNGSPIEVRSYPLENIPIQKTVRISIVMTPQFVELYKDGTLQQTIPLPHPPMPVSPSSYFFPPASPTSSSIYLANVSLYNTILTSKQIQMEALKVASEKFFK